MNQHRNPTPVRVRLRIVATLEADFDADPPSLSGITIDTDGAEVTETKAIRKCQPEERKRRAG